MAKIRIKTASVSPMNLGFAYFKTTDNVNLKDGGVLTIKKRFFMIPFILFIVSDVIAPDGYDLNTDDLKYEKIE